MSSALRAERLFRIYFSVCMPAQFESLNFYAMMHIVATTKNVYSGYLHHRITHTKETVHTDTE